MIRIATNRITVMAILFFFQLGMFCSVPVEENIIIRNTSLKIELRKFKSQIMRNHLDSSKITVYISSSSDSAVRILMINERPNKCENLIGYAVFDECNIFIVSDMQSSSLFEVIKHYKCPFNKEENEPTDKRTSDYPPVAIHYLERAYIYKNDSLKVVRMP